MSYRVEVSANNRAGCSGTQCKKDAVKIKKGEIRQGVMVTFQEHQSWKYRHWGCVTPEVLKNWWETAEGDTELIDGFDTLPEEAQEKVKRALEQGHVDDEDWNGDAEMNRWTGKKNQGMFVKTPKKKATDDEDGDAETPAKKPTKKRGRAKADEAADDVETEKPVAKKARGKKAQNEDADGDTAAPAAKKARGKKAKPEEADVEAAAPATKKQPKAKKAKAETADEDDEPKPAVKKGRKAKAVVKPDSGDDEADPADEPDPVPAKKTKVTKSKKGASKSADDEVADAPPVKPQQRKARGKKVTTEED